MEECCQKIEIYVHNCEHEMPLPRNYCDFWSMIIIMGTTSTSLCLAPTSSPASVPVLFDNDHLVSYAYRGQTTFGELCSDCIRTFDDAFRLTPADLRLSQMQVVCDAFKKYTTSYTGNCRDLSQVFLADDTLELCGESERPTEQIINACGVTIRKGDSCTMRLHSGTWNPYTCEEAKELSWFWNFFDYSTITAPVQDIKQYSIGIYVFGPNANHESEVIEPFGLSPEYFVSCS